MIVPRSWLESTLPRLRVVSLAAAGLASAAVAADAWRVEALGFGEYGSTAASFTSTSGIDGADLGPFPSPQSPFPFSPLSGGYGGGPWRCGGPGSASTGAGAAAAARCGWHRRRRLVGLGRPGPFTPGHGSAERGPGRPVRQARAGRPAPAGPVHPIS